MAKLALAPLKEWGAKKSAAQAPVSKAAAATKKVKKVGGGSAKQSATAKKAMSKAKAGAYQSLTRKKDRKAAKANESAALAAAHALAKQMFDVGGIDKKTMREFDDLCLPKVPEFNGPMIVKIRREANVSQNLFAKYLNTSASTVQQWEAGVKKPSGAAAKLLQVVRKHGIAILS
jgi:putative transcriptional regulator